MINDHKYDCQIVTADDEEINLLYYDKFQPQDQLVPSRPVRQDSGQNPNETRPESGDYFSQSDFSGGMGQRDFHHVNSGPTLAYYMQGFDNTVPGRLKHAFDVTTSGTAYTLIYRVISHAGSLVTVAQKVSDSAYYTLTHTGGTNWTEAAPPVAGNPMYDMASDGTYWYATDGTDIYRRTGTTWAVYNTLDCRLLAYAKERLIAVSAATAGPEVYEVTSGTPPTAFDQLPAGWAATSILASGPFIYITARYSGSIPSRIYHYGLDTAGTALERKGTTEPPIGYSAVYGIGYQNQLFFVAFRPTPDVGYVAAFFKAIPDSDGFLNYELVAESRFPYTGSGDDLPGPPLAESRSIAVPWVDTDHSFEGIAKYDIATGSFSLQGNGATGVTPGGSGFSASAWHKGARYYGRGNTVYFEDTTKYEPTATLITSLADWNNAGLKLWQSAEVSYTKPLPSTATVAVYYTTKDQDEADWTLLGTDSTAGSLGEKFTLTTPVSSRQLALKIVSSATTAQNDAPEIASFSVRSDPTLSSTDAQWQLQRVVRILPRDRKGRGDEFYQKVDEIRTQLMDLAHQSFTFKEGRDTWKVRMTGAGDFKPSLSEADTTTGERSPKDGYLFQLTMEGVRV